MTPSEIPSHHAPLCLQPRALRTGSRITLPDGTIDTHIHVFTATAPLAPSRTYTPRIMTLADWHAFADELAISRAVVVQPSVYGFDNQVLLDALATAPDRLRGVVVVASDVPEPELERMHELGVRGVRINTRNTAGIAFNEAGALMSRIAPLGWTAQFQVNPSQLDDLAALSGRAAPPMVIDHLGFIDLSSDGELGILQRLMDVGNVHVKISAPYRLDRSPRFASFGHAVRRLARSHPQRLLWASDWPHTELWTDMPDDVELIEQTLSWMPDSATRDLIFVANARQLLWSEP